MLTSCRTTLQDHNQDIDIDLGSLFSLLWHYSGGGGWVSPYILPRAEVEAPHAACAVAHWSGPTAFSMVFGLGRGLKFLVFLDFPFLGPLARDSRLLLGLYLSVPLGVYGLWVSSALSLEYIRKKENPRKSPLCHF